MQKRFPSLNDITTFRVLQKECLVPKVLTYVNTEYHFKHIAYSSKLLSTSPCSEVYFIDMIDVIYFSDAFSIKKSTLPIH